MVNLNAANCPVTLPRAAARTMIRLVRLLHRLYHLPAYFQFVAPQLPDVARFNPGHEAVMMGYDFHLSPSGPRLIEVNTNAGGALLAYQAYKPGESYQPPASARHQQIRLLNSFNQEMAKFSRGELKKPRYLIILDEDPEGQFLYPEMQTFVQMFGEVAIPAAIVDPKILECSAAGVFFRGQKVDMVYNRHCDFYLESPVLAGLTAAYLNRQVCLSPNPYVFGLLADKRRMVLWRDAEFLKNLPLSPEDRIFLSTVIPPCCLLADTDPGLLWEQRRLWVFKPIHSHGSKGVLLGRSISRSRFTALDPRTTMAQHLVLPSLSHCSDRDQPVKTDFRLFVYGKKILGIAARVYQGQVTTFREVGSGYAPVSLSG